VFGELFAAARLPKQMNPELHKVLRNEHSADGAFPDSQGKGAILQRMRSKFSREVDDDWSVSFDQTRSN
jgi:hypothetical protein